MLKVDSDFLLRTSSVSAPTLPASCGERIQNAHALQRYAERVRGARASRAKIKYASTASIA